MMRFLLPFALSALSFAATPHAGRRAPSFALPDTNLNYHDLLDYRGKIILLDFIQTSCPICNTSHKIFESIRQKFPDKVQILTVVIPPDTQNSVGVFIAANSVRTPVLFDCGQATSAYVKATPKNPQITMPHLFIIDGAGIIRSDYIYGTGTEAHFETLAPVLNEVTALVKEMGAAKAGPAPAAAKPAPKAAPKK